MLRSRVSRLAVLAAALGLAGCERADAPTLPTQPVLATAGTQELAQPASYRLVREVPPAGIEPMHGVSGVIDRRGGELKLAGHVLSVPRGAVDQPTQFRMELVGTVGADGTRSIVVELTAVRYENGVEVNVGSAGFAEPLNLKLNFERAVDVADPGSVRVLYLLDGTESGRLQDLGGQVNGRNRFIQVKLRHFSKYAVGTG